jgi:hypothetical protein
MKTKYLMCTFLLLSSIASARSQFSCDNQFGENIQIVTEQTSIKVGETVADLERGDFNGDGLKDKIVILRLNKKSKFDDSVTLLYSRLLWPADSERSIQPVNADKIYLPYKDTIALGIIQSNISDKKCHKFVIYNTDYFTVAEVKHLFVHVVPVGDKGYGYTDIQKRVTGNLRHDAIYLDHLMPGIVYWSNGTYMFELPYPDPELYDPETKD